MVAAMLEALTLEGKGCVLEVGTGYGFQTGLIALLVEIARQQARRIQCIHARRHDQ
jgi:protein-L-isoaspartate O-methyltransferase